jgi:hypothetical protein
VVGVFLVIANTRFPLIRGIRSKRRFNQAAPGMTDPRLSATPLDDAVRLLRLKG